MSEPSSSTRDTVETLPPDPCPMCGGDGEYLIEFYFGVQMQDCFACFGSGVQGDE